MDPKYPINKTSAASFLSDASTHVRTTPAEGFTNPRNYNDLKTAQLCDCLSDLLIAEARIVSWFVDLGFDGQCQGEDSSIGGVPCIQSLTD